MTPAHRSYEHVDPAADEGDGLNLAWTRDERACLAIDVGAIVAEELSAVDRYLVRDPYGEATLGIPGATCGAGVVAILHALSRLGPARIVGDVYPDFPYYAARHGGGGRPVWFLERPSLWGDAFADLAELGALCDDAARAGADVIVDESNANYYPPAWSAVGLARDNLCVIRGFSKAFGLGGLRLAYCVGLTERVRELVPPLSASSLSLRVGARILAAGDVTAPLRARIATHRPEMMALLARAGVEDLIEPSEHLPYVLARGTPEALLAARGITGKLHPMASASIYRLSVPLADDRMARLRTLLLA